MGFNLYSPKLGIDYSPRYVGLALSTKIGTVSPFKALRNHRNLTKLSLEISDIVTERSIVDVILGIPVDSNGKLSYKVRNFNGGLCLDFSRVLSCMINRMNPTAKVYLIDERYSTREAKARMIQDKITGSVDAVSAACLVERFIEDEGDYTLLAEPCSFPPPPDLEMLDYSRVIAHLSDTYARDYSPEELSQLRIKALKVASQVATLLLV